MPGFEHGSGPSGSIAFTATLDDHCSRLKLAALEAAYDELIAAIGIARISPSSLADKVQMVCITMNASVAAINIALGNPSERMGFMEAGFFVDKNAQSGNKAHLSGKISANSTRCLMLRRKLDRRDCNPFVIRQSVANP